MKKRTSKFCCETTGRPAAYTIITRGTPRLLNSWRACDEGPCRLRHPGAASFVFATRCGVVRGMSTPIQSAELSPDDPKFYAPPRWRSGTVAAPPIQPSLGESEVPSQVAADSTPTQYEMRLCRQKAIECEEEAKRMPSSFEAEPWLKLAKQWRELAERTEKYSR
jgi:hypothetical protein